MTTEHSFETPTPIRVPVIFDVNPLDMVGQAFVTEDEITITISTPSVIAAVGQQLMIGNIRQFLLGVRYLPSTKGVTDGEQDEKRHL